MLEHYRNYFKLFRHNAPQHMVLWGGYQYGEPTAMASSYESLIEFGKLVKDPNAVILNAGSGASSWMLRKMFPNVIDTDPDGDYLEVVKSICELGELNTDNFLVGKFPKCDYCYYDYGNIERIPNLAKAIDCTSKALYVDDCDTRLECKEMRDYTLSLAPTAKDCIEAKDGYGRWGLIIQK